MQKSLKLQNDSLLLNTVQQNSNVCSQLAKFCLPKVINQLYTMMYTYFLLRMYFEKQKSTKYRTDMYLQDIFIMQLAILISQFWSIATQIIKSKKGKIMENLKFWKQSIRNLAERLFKRASYFPSKSEKVYINIYSILFPINNTILL